MQRTIRTSFEIRAGISILKGPSFLAPAASPGAPLDVAGRSWLIVSTPSATYRAAFPRWQSWSALGGGLLLMFFLSLSFIQHRRYSDSLESRVVRRTQELARAYRDIEGEIIVRSQAETALRQNQEQLQAILNNTTAVVYVKDRQGRYLLVNERYRWLFEVSDAEIIGRTDERIFPADMAAVRANDLKVLAAEAPLEMEEIVPYKGEPRTYLSIKFPLRDQQGSAYAVCGISTDITERKRMEEALLASQQRYDLIITGINDGIWDWNLATSEVYFSPHWKSMLGYAEDEVPNTLSGWQELLHPDDAERATLTNFKPDLLLLDLIMPRLPGGNVVSAFEQDSEWKDVPIVFFTASVWRERVKEHDGIICDHPCLAKPAQTDEIAAFIDANLPQTVRADLPAFLPPVASPAAAATNASS